MAEWTRGAKVGAFAIVLAGAAVGMYSFVGKTRLGAHGATVYAIFHDATGLTKLGRVTVAGIQVGTIKAITLTPDGRARVDIELDKTARIHKDASVGKQTATLLSEPFLAVAPGSENVPLVADGDPLANVIEPKTTDDILQSVGQIADKVNKVADSLANSIGTQQGEQDLKAILHNVEEATDALNQTVRENRQSLKVTFDNLAAITSDARPQAREILENAKLTTENLNKIVTENRADVRGALANARETLEKTDRAGDSLESALKHVDNITARVDRGEGTVGRLTSKEDTLVDEIQGAAEGINDLVGGIARLQTIVGLRADYNFLANTLKEYVEIRLQPREDKYYSIELVSDPRGKTSITQTNVSTTDPRSPPNYRTVETTTTNALRFSAQFARRLGPLTGRFGIKESTGGLGVDLHAFDNRFELQQDVFGFGEQLTPRWRVSLLYEFIKRIWLIGGADQILTADRRDYFVGLSLRFADDDLKTILPFAPSGGF